MRSSGSSAPALVSLTLGLVVAARGIHSSNLRSKRSKGVHPSIRHTNYSTLREAFLGESFLEVQECPCMGGSAPEPRFYAPAKKVETMEMCPCEAPYERWLRDQTRPCPCGYPFNCKYKCPPAIFDDWDRCADVTPAMDFYNLKFRKLLMPGSSGGANLLDPSSGNMIMAESPFKESCQYGYALHLFKTTCADSCLEKVEHGKDASVRRSMKTAYQVGCMYGCGMFDNYNEVIEELIQKA